MATITEFPVNISLQAADRILDLDVWLPFKAMLDHTKQSTPGLRSIAVSFDDQSQQSDSTILIVAEIDEHDPNAPGMADESTEW